MAKARMQVNEFDNVNIYKRLMNRINNMHNSINFMQYEY